MAVSNACHVLGDALRRRGVIVQECDKPSELDKTLPPGSIAHFNLHPDAHLEVADIDMAKSKGCTIIATCHEFTRIRDKHKQATINEALVKADKVIFTNRADYDAAILELPILQDRSRVIAVTSGAWVEDEDFKNKVKNAESLLHNPMVLHAGIIEPIKGTDKVVQAAKHAPDITFCIAGKIPQKHEKYAKECELRKSGKLQWLGNGQGIPANEIVALHNQAAFVYLPFEGGATETSSSIPLAYSAGALVITSEGPHTTNELKGHCDFAATPDEVGKIVTYYKDNPIIYKNRLEAARELAVKKLEASAQATAELYNDNPHIWGGPRSNVTPTATWTR